MKEKRWNLTGFVCPANSHLFEVSLWCISRALVWSSPTETPAREVADSSRVFYFPCLPCFNITVRCTFLNNPLFCGYKYSGAPHLENNFTATSQLINPFFSEDNPAEMTIDQWKCITNFMLIFSAAEPRNICRNKNMKKIKGAEHRNI